MPRHACESAERFVLSREFFGLKLGLENITAFLEQIGSPQNDYATIHLAGTNGKGSTAAMLDSILRAQGYKTGLFTSPHLQDFRERVKVNGRKIHPASLVAFVDRFRSELVRRKLSFFETVAALAFYCFSRAHVDIAVIETGLGGRFDATNVLRPLLTITTDVSRDHTEILGSSLPKIAREKAGIIKPGIPHLIGELPRSAEKVIKRQCRKLRSRLYRLTPRDYSSSVPRMHFDFRCNGLSLHRLKPGLYGEHQLRNAALAVKAVCVARNRGLQISGRAIVQGLQSVRWAGRFQVQQKQGRPTMIFDVCHNVGGVRAFVRSFESRFPGKKALILTGFVKRKEHQRMFDLMASIAREYYLTPLSTRRSEDMKQLAARIDWKGVPVRRFGSLKAAYNRLMKNCSPDDIVAVVGSHYLVGEFFGKYGTPR